MEPQKLMNIIFINKGVNQFLIMALKNAHEYNQNANIILIGDKSVKIDFVNFYDIRDYFNSANKLEQYYTHISKNEYKFELFCIQRWFILKDFVNKYALNNFFYSDSDVLIFSNLEYEKNKFSKFKFTLSEGECGHSSFWNDRQILNEFCNFVEKKYQTETHILKNISKNATKGQSDISDMTLLNIFKNELKKDVGETTKIIENSTYDHNINLAKNGNDEFKKFLGYKDIKWIKGLPYIKKIDGQLIKFNTLHFQGSAKRCMRSAYKKRRIFYSTSLYKNIARNFLYKFLYLLNIEHIYIKIRKK